ncbi:hypothetical protein OI25_3219 [Paraburkholderia fungorum]|uniref:Uncharacterized protein n=1 Tax=Paraburkholderia fungorum TaxID=134537 RepID=A0AAU8SU93_9BURK|nr:hypothetical protein OI25_3219 [Paraburkholderia fungorum]
MSRHLHDCPNAFIAAGRKNQTTFACHPCLPPNLGLKAIQMQDKEIV